MVFTPQYSLINVNPEMMYKYIILAILLAGCTKYPDQPPPVDCKCKVLSIADTVTGFTFDFGYDAQHRLNHRTSIYGGHTAPDFRVFYDANGRVSHYIFDAEPDYKVGDNFFEWHQVYYDNRNNIVLDTVYYDGRIGINGPEYDDGVPPESFMYTRTYAYDAADRLIKATNSMGWGEETFAYSADGNLFTNQFGDSLTYDHKVNWNRTDRFLQFINKDYSKNNPVGASAYNKYGLPLAYPYLGDGHWQLYIGSLGFLHPQFTYACKPS
jgi:hypothetical protein